MEIQIDFKLCRGARLWGCFMTVCPHNEDCKRAQYGKRHKLCDFPGWINVPKDWQNCKYYQRKEI
ncbi:MAG: hypothetical protein UY48_C0043G0004 [Candidatus Gottesmanbacteria bacterium GW2011_GWB1_49_7]|uniref:Uncharacterized protein n=1 Tax=Candidatus Gottesmanbacteria bacterium GW2011_GWB1_49_7 TaxID=1618448 RepID=A0A0G1YV65_9BACT|nr:MAG: hypothetical protein UY48_C0043G0004 [Candidatus Gottesmanbacteria bacterium GW2011_GWB1_49_7]